ncbi:retinal maintenance-domain-containing protein [Entophlyctis helioformis]|nr:retinal maintenance-domain-containing protein [Entophlyctis helioformis]
MAACNAVMLPRCICMAGLLAVWRVRRVERPVSKEQTPQCDHMGHQQLSAGRPKRHFPIFNKRSRCRAMASGKVAQSRHKGNVAAVDDDDIDNLLAELDLPVAASVAARAASAGESTNHLALSNARAPSAVPAASPLPVLIAKQPQERKLAPDVIAGPISNAMGKPESFKPAQDDLDDLLHELGAPSASAFAASSTLTASASTSVSASPLALRATSGSQSATASALQASAADKGSVKAKCIGPSLGGTADPQGLNLACDRLRCTACDFRCIEFADMAWTSECDYLFFRNHMPDRQKLSVQLSACKGSKAYCCQCSWMTVSKLTATASTKTKWVCAGH